MKILYYSPHPQLNYAASTGYGTHMREMVNALKELGHEVEICIIGGTEVNVEAENNSTVSPLKKIAKAIIPEILWSTLKDRSLQNVDKQASTVLDKKVQEFEPDLIYERGFYLMTSGCDIAEQYNISHVVEINAPFEYEKELFEGKTLLSSKGRKLEKRILSQPDLICVVASSIKEYYLKRHPELAQSKIIVTPNAINQEGINLVPVESVQAKINGRTVVGFVGSIFPYHGVDKLIDAFAQTNPAEKNLVLLVVGDGEILGQLIQKTEDLGISDSVIFTRRVAHSEVYSYINLMDITVLANTEWYCSPVKLFDYGAIGKVIISINKTGVTDVMVNDVDGIIINNSDNELVEAINKLSTDKNLRESLGVAFQKKVLASHTWKATAQRVLDTLNERLS